MAKWIPAEKMTEKEVFALTLKAWAQKQNLSLQPEFNFVPGRQFSADWAIKELKILIEYEGGMFGKKGAKRCKFCGELPKGAHFMIQRINNDAEKYNLAAILGFRVIRILPKMVKAKTGDAEKALEYIRKAVEAARKEIR